MKFTEEPVTESSDVQKRLRRLLLALVGLGERICGHFTPGEGGGPSGMPLRTPALGALSSAELLLPSSGQPLV